MEVVPALVETPESIEHRAAVTQIIQGPVTMKYTYTLPITCDLCKVAPEGGGPLFGSLNDLLATQDFGRVTVRVAFATMTMTSSRLLSRKARATVKRTILLEFRERFPTWEVEVGTLRCKSSKSRSQTQSR